MEINSLITKHVGPIAKVDKFLYVEGLPKTRSGAEFIVVICGDVMTMPGLPRKPASENIGINQEKEITGLF